MIQRNRFGQALTIAAMLMSCLAPCLQASAAAPANSRETAVVQDIVLSPAGDLAGQVLETESATVVSLHRGAKMIAQTPTQQEGRFVFRGLRPGVYRLQSGASGATCRLWSVNAAPPSAGKIVQLSAGELIMRGQRPLGSAIFGDPIILGAIILAGAAIPIIIHNTGDDPPAS